MKKKKFKRKNILVFEKRDNKKIIAEYIKKNLIRSENKLGIIKGKLKIGFAENKENGNKNDENNKDKTTEKKFQDEDDEEIDKLKKFENVNKNINKDFIKRMRDNVNFLKKIILYFGMELILVMKKNEKKIKVI